MGFRCKENFVKIMVTENTEAPSPFNDGCVIMVGFGRSSAPGGWMAAPAVDP